MFYMDKKTVEKNFSKCAEFYDRYANIQRLTASRLIGLTPDAGVKNILEIGCGTGNYTAMLKEKFKAARIKTVDISKEMVGVARLKAEVSGVEFLVADAEKMDLNDNFDLVTSNVSFQWFENMELSIERYKGALSEGGVIAFSTFGPLTFLVLGKVLREVTGEVAGIDSSSFLDKDKLEALLKRYFRESVVEGFTVKETYPSLKDLLIKIKYTGARGNGLRNTLLWKKDMLKKAQELYETIFGAIEASYQLFFCKGLK